MKLPLSRLQLCTILYSDAYVIRDNENKPLTASNMSYALSAIHSKRHDR